MNKLLLPVLLFGFSAAFGQKAADSAFELKQLPASVTGQWKFHAGDNLAWADTAFNDQGWEQLDLTRGRHFLPLVSKAQICWFRLTMDVAPALRGRAIALVINQSGAAEIYFNGAPVRSMGRIGANGKTDQSYRSDDEPLTLQLTKATKQYVAIRYSFDRSIPVLGYGYPIVRASFYRPDSAWNSFFLVVEEYATRSWVAGCFMLLCILQLAIYFLNRKRKINLYLAIYAFLQLSTFTDGLLIPISPNATAIFVMETAFNIAAPLAWVLLLAMTIEIFGFKRDWRFYVSAWLCPPVIAIIFIAYHTQAAFFALYIQNISIYIFIISISINAVKQKKPGAWLFLTGIIISFIFFILFSNIAGLWQQSLLLISFESVFAFLIPAVLLALLLAREFVQNIRSLQEKLAEVESLSSRSMRQEAEKQQILARQNETLEQKVTERTAELNQSLTELKAAQRQLIQSEKMASLGELTAGIAHEIQNPLNFVNNFSEVNREMLEELKAESEKPKAERDEELEVTLINDLIGNEKKINHHGKRADAIVKGMLEHSRANTGEKQLSDMNMLCDEFLKLSYHGLRAKDKSFNAEIVTHFDPHLPKANVSQQDMGRVMLNLFNNAFYAVNQKSKTAGADYKPEVSVTTMFISPPPASGGPGVVAIVRDNGIGIPDAIKDKIMQPFFTTKPTGEGTGLGLSLSYDIVVKGHGGTITVNTKEGEFTEFVVTLPI
jgi:two-component system NtrC family sensor kinase